MRALDLFCGAGLSSSGARAAGVTMVGAVDMDAIAAQTYQHNFPDAHVVNGLLENVSLSKLRDKIGDIELLLASPECTNHTCAKGSAPRSEESRATAMQTLRFARAFEPRWIVMENVVHMRPWSRYTELLDEIRGLGYNVREQVLDASLFGVPQKRRRLFVICDKERAPSKVEAPDDARSRTVRQVLARGEQWAMTPLRKKGRAKDTLERATRAIKELGDEQSFLIVYYGSDGSGGWQRLDRPLRTITTVDRFALVKPTHEGHMMRMLQVPELQRAMGVADTYEFPIGTRRDKIRLLGNGVCPPVMQRIVESLDD